MALPNRMRELRAQQLVVQQLAARHRRREEELHLGARERDAASAAPGTTQAIAATTSRNRLPISCIGDGALRDQPTPPAVPRAGAHAPPEEASM